jgi:hypothetical protein
MIQIKTNPFSGRERVFHFKVFAYNADGRTDGLACYYRLAYRRFCFA